MRLETEELRLNPPTNPPALRAPGEPEAAASAAPPTPLRIVAAAFAPISASIAMVPSAPLLHAARNGVPDWDGASNVLAPPFSVEASISSLTALAAAFEDSLVGGPSARALAAAL